VIESAEKAIVNKPFKGVMSAVSMVTSPKKTAAVVQTSKPAKTGKTVRRVFLDDGTGERTSHDRKHEHRHSQDYQDDNSDKGDLRKTIVYARDLREKLNERKQGGFDERFGGLDDLAGLEGDLIAKKKEKKISIKRVVSMDEKEKRDRRAERVSQESDSGDIRVSSISSSSRQIERKISLLDEANFEPDYDDSESGSSASQVKVKSSKHSPSPEKHKKHKHRKHKKHRHKHKKHKHKHDKEKDKA
jgi:hypothetical protein